MALFDLGGALGDLFKEKDELTAGMNKPVDFADADKFLDNAERLDQLNTAGGFMGALGENMMSNAKTNLGFGADGQWSMKNFMDAQGDRKDDKSPVPPIMQMKAPAAKLMAAQGMPQGLPQQAQQMAQAAGMPQVGPSPAMQQIMQAQQAQQNIGQAQMNDSGGLLAALRQPTGHKKTGALNVPEDWEGGLKDMMVKMAMAGMA